MLTRQLVYLIKCIQRCFVNSQFDHKSSSSNDTVNVLSYELYTQLNMLISILKLGILLFRLIENTVIWYRCNSFIVDLRRKFTVRNIHEIPVFFRSGGLSYRT